MSERVLKCPVCGDKEGRHHQHLYVNEEEQKYFCHLCGAGGNLKTLLKKFPYLGMEITIAEIARAPRAVPWAPVPSWSCLIRQKNSLAKKVAAYLIGRGLPDSEIEKVFWSSRMPTRAIFPCYENGEMVFWSARSMGGEPKWKFPVAGETKLTRRDAIWGLEKFEGYPDKEIWITEGVFDAVAVGGVALHGKYASQNQIKKILALRPVKIILALDKDAKEQAQKIAEKLVGVLPFDICYAPTRYKDWGETLLDL